MKFFVKLYTYCNTIINICPMFFIPFILCINNVHKSFGGNNLIIIKFVIK